MKLPPSDFSPGLATNKHPGVASLESSTMSQTLVSPSPRTNEIPNPRMSSPSGSPCRWRNGIMAESRQDQHRIAVAVKAIPTRDRLSVDMLEAIQPDHRRDQREQR